MFKTLFAAAAFSVALAGSAMAAEVTVDFEAEVLSNQVVAEFGIPQGFSDVYVGSTGSGSFTYTYDDSAPAGYFFVDMFTLTLDLVGLGSTYSQTFTEAAFDAFIPAAVITDASGDPVDLFFSIFDDHAFTLAFENIIEAPFVFAIESSSFTPGAQGSPAFVGLEIQTTPIPLPASLPILLSGVAAFGFVRSRRRTKG